MPNLSHLILQYSVSIRSLMSEVFAVTLALRHLHWLLSLRVGGFLHLPLGSSGNDRSD